LTIVDGATVSVVISARDAAATVANTLDGLHHQSGAPRFEVVFVDNGSNDDTAAIVQAHPLDVRLIRRERGEGPGAGRNAGVAAADGALIAFTDADCQPMPGWLAAGVRASGSADIVQGAVRPAGVGRVGPFDRTLTVASEYGLYETANLFVARDWFDKVGGFTDWVHWTDESGHGRALPVPDRPFGEDAWFAWRAKRLGARTAFAPDALVHHAIFPGDVRTFVGEQARVRYFPALVARIPELRRVLAWNRYFLSSRTAAFDTAVVSAAAALLTTSPVPLVGLIPYAVLGRRALREFPLEHGRDVLRFSAALLAHDAVGFFALVRGSVEARTPLF
jgi:glycosyltransferase involved in cell wall biosynthesis